MPIQLPGFYWDEQRNRYFPLSAGQPPAQTQPVAMPSGEPHPVLRRARPLWRLSDSLRSTLSQAKRTGAIHEALAWHYSRPCKYHRGQTQTFGRMKAFCTTRQDGICRRFIGDDQGWLYSATDGDADDPSMRLWAVEFNLHPDSEISSINISGSNCVATCFGPTTRISIQDLLTPARTAILTLTNVRDVRASHLEGNSLVMGAHNQAVYLSDISVSPPVRLLNTKSDVFAVCQNAHLVYAGARNGSICRFDLRLGRDHGQLLFDDRPCRRNPVLHLGVTKGWQLLVSQMDGHLATYDLRFCRSSHPLIRFSGHQNTVKQRLGIAMDPTEEFLFAAGEDNRIRGWSLKDGTPLPMPPDHASFESPQNTYPGWSTINLFNSQFDDPIEALHVSEEGHSQCLWVLTGKDLYQCHLGQF